MHIFLTSIIKINVNIYWNNDLSLLDNCASHSGVPELSLSTQLGSWCHTSSRHGTNSLGLFLESKIWSSLQPCHDYWNLGKQIAIVLDI